MCGKPFALCNCEIETIPDIRTKAILYVDDRETRALIKAIADEVMKRIKEENK